MSMNLKVTWKNKRHKTFKQVFQIIKKESGLKDYVFIYTNDRTIPITIKVNEIYSLETTFD